MKRHDVGITCLVFVCSLMLCNSASAQWGDTLKKLGKAASDANSKKSPSKTTKPTDSSPGVAESPSAESSKSKSSDSNSDKSKSDSNSDAAPATSSAKAADADVTGQPNLSAVKIDFVPGEKTIFFDDFSDMAPDEPPPHWKVRGGTVELRMGGSIHELYSKTGPQLTSSSLAIPQNFTAQFVLTGNANREVYFRKKDDSNIFHLHFRGNDDNKRGDVSVDGPGGSLGSAGDIPADLKAGYELDFWAQQGRVRVYLNGQRVVDVNQVEFPPIDHLLIQEQGGYDAGMRSVRVAESAPDPGSILASTGKYVTHGINFDTNSDRLKPESAPVIKQVAAALIKNPNLKLEVDGFTDSTGDAAKNVDLSKRRAAAVQEVLVSQFGIDAGRLKSNGFGPDKPMASNDTPDGRAQNRRVEFIKQ